jgi:CheY-like chemotaxis protein
MTGHLVLATLHTNDAVGAIPRLLDLGLDRASLAATLRGVVAQRLIRRVCSHCAAPAPDTPSVAMEHLTQLYGLRQMVVTVGCTRCGRTGYRGRIPAAEVLVMDAPLQELVANGVSPPELERAAARAGMRTMLDAALERVRASETTLEEVERVLGEVEESPARSVEPHVLVVDDDPVLRLVVRSLLEAQGFRVSEASDGLAALKKLNEEPETALMILDLEMPRFGGEEVIRRLRSSIGTAGLPIVVLTGSGSEDAEARLIGLGADDYIRKPLDPSRFVARTKAALRRAGA